MTQTIQIQVVIGGESKVLSVPAYDSLSLQSYGAYLVSVLTDSLLLVDSVSQIRCSLTGMPIALVLKSEIQASIATAAMSSDFDCMGDIYESISIEAQGELIESLIDKLAIKTLIRSRPSTSVAMIESQTDLAALPQTHQIALLLNRLVFDAGMYRGNQSSDEAIECLHNCAAMADRIVNESEGGNNLDSLHGFLIELDAKYHIAALKLASQELASLSALTVDSPWADFEAVVCRLVTNRDTKNGIAEGPARWTQNVFADVVYRAAEHESKSNILANMPKLKPGHIAGGKTKTAKPRSEKAIQTAKRVDLFTANMHLLFGGEDK